MMLLQIAQKTNFRLPTDVDNDRADEIARWLRVHVRATKAPTVPALGLKHVVEKHHGYLCRATFLEALLRAGFQYKVHRLPTAFGVSVDLHFAMSRGDWNRLATAN